MTAREREKEEHCTDDRPRYRRGWYCCRYQSSLRERRAEFPPKSSSREQTDQRHLSRQSYSSVSWRHVVRSPSFESAVGLVDQVRRERRHQVGEKQTGHT